MNLRVGSKIVHALHGVGSVESIEEKTILNKVTRFSVICFEQPALKIMVNVDGKNNMIRPLIEPSEVDRVMDHLKNFTSPGLISKSTQRYHVNLLKIKSGEVFPLCEVIKELTGLVEDKKLTQKEQTMLEQSRRILAAELSEVTKRAEAEMEQLIDQTCCPKPVLAGV